MISGRSDADIRITGRIDMLPIRLAVSVTPPRLKGSAGM
jgi:hypothetical protein